MPVRSGSEYIAGLSDGRDVWYRGEPVADVSVHPAFASSTQAIAQFYDLQLDPAYQQLMTYGSPQTGELLGLSFRMPRCVDDLVARRAMHEAWAVASGGMLVQSPDYANTGLMALASARDILARADPRFGIHALRYYEQCREQDVCVAHVPVLAASLPSETPASSQPSRVAPLFQVTSSGSEGLRVSGMSTLVPSAPIADEVLICGGPALKSGQGQHALAFALPLGTPGISLVCQETYGRSNTYNHPLAARFESPDCVMLFEDVLVPWERVFLSGNVELHNRFMATSGFAAQVGHQVLTRQVAKTMLLLGVAEQLSQAIGITGFLHVQAKLGELITTLEAMRSCLRRAEVDATAGAGGVWVPEGHAIRAGQRLFAGSHPRMVEILQLLGAGGFMMTPSEADIQGPMADAIAKYYQGAGVPADERIRLFRLAWDIVGDHLGMQQQIYESEIPADAVHAMASDYQAYDFGAVVALAKAFLTPAESESEARTAG